MQLAKFVFLLVGGIPLFGAANLTISSASLAADGITNTLTMSAGSLTGSAAGCFVLHGGNTNSNTVSTAVLGAGSTITVTYAAPVYSTQTATIDMATAGAGCAITSGANTPQGQTGQAVTNLSEWLPAGGAPMSTYATYDGSPAFGDQSGLGYPAMADWNSALGSISVNVSGATAVHIWGWHGNNAYCLQQDGVDIGGRQKMDGASAMSDITLATGLSGTHLYRILGCAGQSAFQNVLIPAVRFVGGTLTGTPAAAKRIIGACGDSIVGSGSGPDDSRTIDWWLDAIAGGYSAQIYTASGALVSGAGGLATTCGAKSLLVGGAAPDIWVLTGGVNDQAAGVAIGDNSTGFQGAMVAMIRAVQGNAHPPAHLLVRGILPNLDTNYANRALYTAAQQAAVIYVNTTYNTNVVYYGTDGWIDPAAVVSPCNGTQDTIDHLHPCGATSLSGSGYGKIAALQASIFATVLGGPQPSRVLSGSVTLR